MKINLNHLKWLAFVSMCVDHLGHFFFPGILWLRIIGRLAFPIFSATLAKGVLNSKNPIKIFNRLLLYGIPLQFIIYLFGSDFKNILLNYALYLIPYILFVTFGKKYLTIISIPFCLFLSINLDYGWEGMLYFTFFLCWDIFPKLFRWQIYLMYSLPLALASILNAFFMPVYLIIKLIFNPDISWGKVRYNFYVIYSAHIVLFVFLKVLL